MGRDRSRQTSRSTAGLALRVARAHMACVNRSSYECCRSFSSARWRLAENIASDEDRPSCWRMDAIVGDFMSAVN